MDRQRQEEVLGIPNWSELCPDLLRCVFKRLSFTDYNRAKSVCSSWHSALRDFFPEPNQNPWLILFPHYEKSNNNTSSCMLVVPEDREKVYKTRDLGVDFLKSSCLATYGSWLLMMDYLCSNLYIFNPLTRERIDLPDTKTTLVPNFTRKRACFWIDNKTKDYLVVAKKPVSTVFTKKGHTKWQEFPPFNSYVNIVYNQMNQKLYLYHPNDHVKSWDFSGDHPREDGSLGYFGFSDYYNDFPHWSSPFITHIVVTVSGDVLIVVSCRVPNYKTLLIHIYKENHVKRKWEKIDSLGDEALILDMGITVLAKDVPGIKRNSIYFSENNHNRKDPARIFVFDLTTQEIELLPQCVFSSVQFSDARWFFPGLSG